MDQIVRRGGFVVDLPVEKAFPLFTPEGEGRWAEGWSFDWIYPKGPESVEGGLFSTRDTRGREMIWRVQSRKPPREARYYNVTAGSHTTEIEVQLKPRGDGRTDVSVSYTYTPFSQEGVDFVSPITEEAYVERMRHWDHSIRACLQA